MLIAIYLLAATSAGLIAAVIALAITMMRASRKARQEAMRAQCKAAECEGRQRAFDNEQMDQARRIKELENRDFNDKAKSYLSGGAAA